MLARRNAERRAAVWVCINATDGRGRKRKNVTRVRAVFLDGDGLRMGGSELSSNVVDGEASGGVLKLGLAIDKADATDHLAEAGSVNRAAALSASLVGDELARAGRLDG